MTKRGFTLIEILVVISIIGVLSGVVMASLATARTKANDARRKADMQSIYTAVNLFYDKYDCLPLTTGSTCIGGYSDANAGGWDYSSQGGFMGFLVTSGFMSKVPVDPVNNMSGDSTAGEYAYRYYCYPTGSANPGLHLGYYTQSSGWVYLKKSVSSPTNDPSFSCK